MTPPHTGAGAMRWLYPRFPVRRLPAMIRISLAGLALAAVYGAVHDQLSFTLSPEYFTKFKFRQFAWADAGWPPAVFASVVGVLATGWVGVVSGWLLSRCGLAELPAEERRGVTARAFGIVAALAPVGGLIGGAVGVVVSGGDLSGWADWQRTLNLTNLPAFVVVAHLHAGGYLGALAGLVLAAVFVRRRLARHRRAAPGLPRGNDEREGPVKRRSPPSSA